MTNARSLANFATGIGTEGAVLTVDNTNNRIGIATTNPQNDLQVGAGITMEGDTGQVTFVGIVTAEGFRNSDGSVVGAGSTDNIITGTAATFTSDVNIADSIIHVGDANTKIRFPAADTFTIETGGTERIRVGSAGSVSIGPIDSSSIATLSAAGSNTDLRLRAVGSGGFFDVETNSESRLRITSAGRIGIGTGSPGGLLTVYGDPAEVRIQHDGNSSYSRLISDSNNQFNIYTGGGPNLAMVIDSNQDVGIGTTNPGTKLDVRGGNWANGDIVVGEKDNAGRIKFARGADGSDSGSIGFAAADSNSVLSMNVASGDGTLTFQTNSTERVRITSGGDVGIGSQSPARKLDVDGIARFIETVEAYNTSGGSQDWFVSSASFGFHDGNGVGFDAGGGLFRLAISGTERVRINSGGDVNITGITTASQFDATSDVALKENIEVIDEPIVKISELKGVTFDWKKGGHSVGVIAQDVEKVLPTAVGGSKDQKTVNYNAIIGLLVESVKDQQKQIEELKSLLDK